MMKSILLLVLASCSVALADTSFLRALGGSPNCPKQNPLDTGRTKCNAADGLSCGYGSESCCGETFDAIVCECFNNDWACRVTHACQMPYCECPLEAPEPMSECRVPSTKTCSYGTETCCGETYDSFICQCDAEGVWICYNSDVCFAQPCEEPFP